MTTPVQDARDTIFSTLSKGWNMNMKLRDDPSPNDINQGMVTPITPMSIQSEENDVILHGTSLRHDTSTISASNNASVIIHSDQDEIEDNDDSDTDNDTDLPKQTLFTNSDPIKKHITNNKYISTRTRTISDSSPSKSPDLSSRNLKRLDKANALKKRFLGKNQFPDTDIMDGYHIDNKHSKRHKNGNNKPQRIQTSPNLRKGHNKQPYRRRSSSQQQQYVPLHAGYSKYSQSGKKLSSSSRTNSKRKSGHTHNNKKGSGNSNNKSNKTSSRYGKISIHNHQSLRDVPSEDVESISRSRASESEYSDDNVNEQTQTETEWSDDAYDDGSSTDNDEFNPYTPSKPGRGDIETPTPISIQSRTGTHYSLKRTSNKYQQYTSRPRTSTKSNLSSKYNGGRSSKRSSRANNKNKYNQSRSPSPRSRRRDSLKDRTGRKHSHRNTERARRRLLGDGDLD